MIPRHAHALLLQRLAANPAVALLGPRQCGKTTLARSLGGVYVDCEQDAERLVLDLDWDRLSRGRELLILDEAQSWPALFPMLRAAVDSEPRRKGRFLLLGSVSPALMKRVSESLAGRLALVELTPFVLGELSGSSRERLWLTGGFPGGGVLRRSTFPQWQRDYLALLTQRDLPAWGLPAKPQNSARLLRMLAAAHGQTWNASRIGQSLGVDYKTVNAWIDYFIGAYLVRFLQPYHANLRKRLVKSPKMYLRDTGLLHALLNATDRATLLAQPWVGSSWEGFCIEQALGTLAARGRQCDPYYFRSSDGYEIDLVLDFGNDLWAVECKLTSSPAPEDFRRLDKAADMIGAARRYLVSRTKTTAGTGTRMSCGLERFLSEIGS
jgi:predicted AAA+ superfamily ATPase